MQEVFEFCVDNEYLAGIDEVGRGPLAGPVIAAAVILDIHNEIDGLRDSKKLSSSKREEISIKIKQGAYAWGIGRAEYYEIDEHNILQASLIAMRRAFEAMGKKAEFAVVDGLHCPELPCQVEAIIKGDQKIPAISAASIIAKVERDTEMIKMDDIYPGYGFARHKGYPTREHLEALKTLGICEIHRRTYAPVKKYLHQEKGVHAG
jgi:ribonuclease HII